MEWSTSQETEMPKTKTTEQLPTYNPHKFVVDFWRYIELNATVDGQKTVDRQYFGLKPSDSIEIPVKDATGSITMKRTTVETVWRTICGLRRQKDASFMAPDLTMASFAARNDRQLFAWTVSGKKGGKFEGKRFGTKFWTPLNEKFTITPGRKSQDGLELANDFSF
jgi:hypothetical protein